MENTETQKPRDDDASNFKTRLTTIAAVVLTIFIAVFGVIYGFRHRIFQECLIRDYRQCMLILASIDSSLLDKGSGKYSFSPLQLTIALRNIDLVEFLLANGASPSTEDDDFLFYAIREKDHRIINLLLKYGAKPQGNHLLTSLEYGMPAIASLMKAKGASPNEAFELAAYGDDAKATRKPPRPSIEVMKELKKLGADPIVYEAGAMNNAISSRKPNIVEFLLDDGADPRIAMKMLSRQIDYWTRYGSGWEKESAEILHLLLKRGAKLDMAPEGTHAEVEALLAAHPLPAETSYAP